jgi:hypothetical protein
MSRNVANIGRFVSQNIEFYKLLRYWALRIKWKLLSIGEHLQDQAHDLLWQEGWFEKEVEKDLSGRVAELAAKSTAGTLSQEEQAEYERIVCLNDLLSVLKLQTEVYWAPRIAS